MNGNGYSDHYGYGGYAGPSTAGAGGSPTGPSNYNNPNAYVAYEEPGKEEINLAPKRPLFRRPWFVGLFFTIIGLAIGGGVCFGIMKSLADNNPKTCNCPTLPDLAGKTMLLNTSFLKMELSSNNIIYSPLSIRYGLSLLNAGAAEETKTQIENILGEEDLPVYDNVPDTLSLANAVFIRASFKDKVLSSYTKKVTNDYGAEILYDSFTSAENMNNWVSNKTFGLIKSIGIEPTPDLQMVLANALAIQMNWQHKFDTNDTFGMTFYKEDDSEILATMMKMDTRSEDISYYTDEGVTILQMPLEATEETALKFVAVMPAGNLTDYIKNLDFGTIESALQNMTPASTPQYGVKIYIPKFKFDYELKFKEDLESLGMTYAFDANVADFSKISSEDRLYVSNAVHKANIDFSEEGIKAAAVTAFGMSDLAMPGGDVPQPVVINIDKPFYFMIYDSNNNAVWFSGAMYEPNLWENDAPSYQPSI